MANRAEQGSGHHGRGELIVAAGVTAAGVVASALALRRFFAHNPEARAKVRDAHQALRRGARAAGEFMNPVLEAARTQLQASAMDTARDVVATSTNALRDQIISQLPPSERRHLAE